MSSKTAAVFPIVSALQQARLFGKAESDWMARGEGAKMQERYIPLLSLLEKQLHLFSKEELKAIASTECEVINAFLKENGFDIQLDPFQDADSFGVASIMSVLVKWQEPGTETELEVDGKAYKAARLEYGISFTRVKDYEHPVVVINTENGDMVYLTQATNSKLEGLDLLEKVQSLSAGMECYDFGAVVFPMVDLDQEVDISFFLRMAFSGITPTGKKDLLTILQAKQQTKFKMNHLGAKAESAAAFEIGLECCAPMPKPDLIINQDFYVWMTRPGLDAPYFAGCIDPSDWKDPGEIK